MLEPQYLSFAALFLIQFGSTVWFLAKLASRVASLEEDRRDRKGYIERLVKIETYLEVMQRQQDEQIIRLDKVLDNQSRRMRAEGTS